MKVRIVSLFLIFTILSANASESYFDPKEIALEEVSAWKDYYNNDITGLMKHLSHALIMEFKLNQLTVWGKVIPQLIMAASKFKKLPDDSPQEIYEKKVLPHLVKAYEGIRNAMHGNWDTYQAAQTELEWWIYRRDKQTANPEIVGKKITELYQLIYGHHDQQHFIRAGYLRAVAGRYHDLGKKVWNSLYAQDWIIMQRILELSYQEMLLGIQANQMQKHQKR